MFRSPIFDRKPRVSPTVPEVSQKSVVGVGFEVLVCEVNDDTSVRGCTPIQTAVVDMTVMEAGSKTETMCQTDKEYRS